MQTNGSDKSLESWIWDAACSIRGAKDAPKFKDFILPLIFTKRRCDVFDDELNRIAREVGSRAKAFRLVKHDKKLVRFYLPLRDPHRPGQRPRRGSVIELTKAPQEPGGAPGSPSASPRPERSRCATLNPANPI